MLNHSVDYLPWNASEFDSASTKSSKRFPPQSFGLIDKLAIIVNSKGHIVVWYLPGLLLPARQVFMFYLIAPTSHTYSLTDGVDTSNKTYREKDGKKCQEFQSG